jgi:predicted thioredoxin/glutaredoxin
MKVEFFYAGGCGSCSGSREELAAAARRSDSSVEWREFDAAKELDYAVELGVTSLPAVAVDGQLVVLPFVTPEHLSKVLLAKRQEAARGCR